MQPDQNEETKRAALYARASGQDEEAIQTQLEAMQPHVEENGLEVVREYADQPGTRAKFEEMLAEATGENPPFQQILVYDAGLLSHLLRECQEYRAKLEENGVTLTSIT